MRVGIALIGAALAWGQTGPPPVLLPNSGEDLAKGERLYNAQCAGCHGPKGEGAKGPTLARSTLPRAADDAALLRVIENGIPGTEMPGAYAMILREVSQVAAYVKSLGRIPQQMVTGDALKGEQIYHGRGGCPVCHAINGVGGISGPDLSRIGARRSVAHLLEALVNPSAELPDGFAWVEAIDRTGRKLEGVRLNEDTFSIQFRDAKGALRSYWKRELKDLKVGKDKSPMPAYDQSLNEAERGDVAAYLASLGGGK
jgi:putative heme-binding domain-containing protein